MASKALSAWPATGIVTMQSLRPYISHKGTRALWRSNRSRNGIGITRNNFTAPRRHPASQAPPKQPQRAKPQPRPYQPRDAQSSARPAAPEEKKFPVAQMVRERWFGILGFGAAVLCIGYITASTTMYWRRTADGADEAGRYPLGCEPVVPTGRPSIQSPYEFDLHLDKSEHRVGITKLRNQLASAARGHVLEVAVGTGRNFEFYDWSVLSESLAPATEEKKPKKKRKGGSSDPNAAVTSFTGIDISPGMLDIALTRIRQVIPHMATLIPKKASFVTLAAKANAEANANHPDNTTLPKGINAVSLASDQIRLMQSDVQAGLPAPPPSSSSPYYYDTVLQSFGLCSVRDPVSLVVQMAGAVKPNSGRILMLEHGRSFWDMVNSLLDRGARDHHARFGCWWNRDIEAIVAEAAHRVPGLEIVRLERPGWWQGGTHFVVELRVRCEEPERPAVQEEKQKQNGWGIISWK